jgi:hypothetical protein
MVSCNCVVRRLVTPRIFQNIPGKNTGHTPMAPKKIDMNKDRTSDFLFAVAVGFLVNLLLGVALPEIGAFIAGLVSGVLVREGPMRGGIAGFLAGTLGGLAGLAFWLTTNLFSIPSTLLGFAFQYAILILTAEYAALSLSGGIIGCAMATGGWTDLLRFVRHQKPRFPSFPTTPVELEKQED